MKEIQLASKNIPHEDESKIIEHTQSYRRVISFAGTAGASIVLTIVFYIGTFIILDKLQQWILQDYREPFLIFLTLFVPGMCVVGTVYYWRRNKQNVFWHLITSIATIVMFILLSTYVLATVSMGNRDKGTDANIKASINNARAAAELYYDGNNRSYNGMCENDVDGTIALIAAAKHKGAQVYCYDSVESYAVEAKLTEQKGSFFCIDSLGTAITTEGTSISADDHACGDEVLTVFPDDLYGIGVHTSTDYWATYANDLFSDRRSTTYTETSGIVFEPTDNDVALIEKARLLIGGGDPLVSINFIKENNYLSAYSSTTGGYTIWGSEVPLRVIDSVNNVAEIYGNGTIEVIYARDQ